MCSTPASRSAPVAGRATSFTVYWKRVSLHGTTSASRSCPAGSSANTSNAAPSISARMRVPPGSSTMSIASPFARMLDGPCSRRGASTAPRGGITAADLPHSRPVARSNTHTSGTHA